MSRGEKKILWLCSWYPNKLQPYDGDFIQRHARAVSLLHPVETFCVIKDEQKKLTDTVFTDKVTDGDLTENVIYYHPKKTGIHTIDKLVSYFAFLKYFKAAIKSYIFQKGKPSFVHLHVSLRAGTIALWLKKKYKVPYLISEHWTGFLPEAKPQVNHFNNIQKKHLKKIFSYAAGVTVVSKVLGEALIAQGFISSYSVVPNVVDTSVFYPSALQEKRQEHFVHISSLNYQKNFEQIAESLAIVKCKGFQFTMHVYSSKKEEFKKLVHQYDLQDRIFLFDEAPQHVLAKDLQTASALILYSRYETFGCVVIEANACGIPAVVSNLPVFKEYSLGAKTAFYVSPDAPGKLAETIIKFISAKVNIDPDEISSHVRERFNYHAIAAKFDQIYQTLFLEP